MLLAYLTFLDDERTLHLGKKTIGSPAHTQESDTDGNGELERDEFEAAKARRHGKGRKQKESVGRSR